MPTYKGTNGNDGLVGTSGDDLYYSSLGEDYFIGGAGYDKAWIDYSATSSTQGSVASRIAYDYELQGHFFATISGAYTGAPHTNLSGVEWLDVKLGTSSDSVSVDLTNLASYASGWTVAIDGGGGNDTLRYVADMASAAFTGSALTGTLSAGSFSVTSFERFELELGRANDIFTLGAADDRVDAGGGDDQVTAGAGNDIVAGRDGADRIDGGDGDDVLASSYGDFGNDVGVEIDTLIGGAGNDQMIFGYGDNADGGTGTDRMAVSFQPVENGVTADFSALFAGGSITIGGGTITGFEGFVRIGGSAGDDRITVGNTTDGKVGSVSGEAGNDTITTGSGAEIIYGGNGNDVLSAGAGNDKLYGDNGTDKLNGGAGDDQLTGGNGNDVLDGGDGNDIIDSAKDWYVFNDENDDDIVRGGAGDDRLSGGYGYDQLFGGAGNDTLQSSSWGSFLLDGGTGDDSYYDYAVDGPVTIVEAADAGNDTLYTINEDVSLVGTNVENITGLYDVSQVLTGTDGANRIDGGGGDDLLIGGGGNDTYIVSSYGDRIYETESGGVDRVESNVTYALDDFIETLVLGGDSEIDGYGNDRANTITGNWRDNVIQGGAGNDVISGGGGNDVISGGAGADTLTGGTETDIFAYHNQSESAGSEIDTIKDFRSGTDWLDLGWANAYSVSISTASGVNTVTAQTVNGTMTIRLEGTIAKTDIILTQNLVRGTAGNDSLTGSAEADVLWGGGGADKMSGAGGDDYYYVDNSGDVVTEAAGGGTDLVESSISYTLGANVEQLLLTGSAALSGTGNSLDNIIFGNVGDNLLSGGGGEDTFAGSIGNDSYAVDSAGDQVLEFQGEGNDTVRSSVNYSIATTWVENLVLIGAAALEGVGNGLDNSILGNDAANRLDGGEGIDRLEGGLGNDTYVVDDARDTVVELSGGGTDTVEASASYTLGAQLEKLVLIGSGDIDGTGNALANVITGNEGSNIIDGGAGADTMRGGGGVDTFVVDNVGDVVVAEGSIGGDLVLSSISYSLGDSAQHLTLTGTANLTATGNSSYNIITGNDGDNLIDGGEGQTDELIGGLGNDTYVVYSHYGTSSNIVEKDGEGTDTVRAGLSYTLGANVERLQLTGADNIFGIGNALDNELLGNGAANSLDGAAGADRMAGGAGNDSYWVDNVGDTVVEAAGGGSDTVHSSVSYTLTANVEILYLVPGYPAAAINGTGNALANTIYGTEQANVIDGGTGADTMYGYGGDDIYVVDNAGDVADERYGGGHDIVRSSLSFTLGYDIEELVLTGAADLNGTGSEWFNRLTGNAGNNILNGGLRADTMIGGAGNDTYVVDDAGDMVVELAGEGVDTVISAVSYTLGENVENLTLDPSWGVDGTGNSLDNVIRGSAGGNRLDGGGGADTLIGGAGNDTYIVDALDKVVEASGGGIDMVVSAGDYVLGGYLEGLTLTGTADLSATGNTLNNRIVGNAGNNLIDGGAGGDSMDGGGGNDVYIADNSDDIAAETSASGGTDLVKASASVRIGDNIEKLLLIGTADINGTGNNIANVITGNSGANVLDGGFGADTLIGGLGSDTYEVENAGDKVVEAADGGMDLVRARTSYALAANVEKLTLLTGLDLNATGNTLNNTLTGNDGKNVLDGKSGADLMSGGLGNDVYVVDNVGDKAIETLATGGIDLVKSSVAFELGDNLEKLTLTGQDDIAGSGNALANTIVGNIGMNSLKGGAGNDVLDGGFDDDRLYGGLDRDTLTGGAGKDRFYFDTALDPAANVDKILDFTSVDDTIFLSRNIFTAIGVGALSASAFVAGTAALDADDRIIYNKATGNLLYDADGNGEGAAILFANVGAGTAINHADFTVF